MAAFSARLRDKTDLDTLSAEQLALVNQTMQPTQASLWLRPPQDRRGRLVPAWPGNEAEDAPPGRLTDANC
jgi:hypothetical protein